VILGPAPQVVPIAEAPSECRPAHVPSASIRDTVFVFPGRVSQWSGTAAELLDSSTVFADQIRLCDAAFAEFVDWSVFDAVRGGITRLDPIDREQPLLFALAVSLAAHWRALGFGPDAVVGHSQGEIAAAYVAGALSLRDAATVVTSRIDAITAIAGTGGMATVRLPIDAVATLLARWRGAIYIAAHNGPSSIEVSGDAGAIDEFVAVCQQDEVPVRRIPVDYAAHSPHVDAVWDTVREALSGLRPRTRDTVYISAVTGAGLDTSILDGDYWFANIRQPVLFDQAVRWSWEHGYRTFIESSPHPVLSADIAEAVEDYRRDRCTASQRAHDRRELRGQRLR